MKDAIGRGWTLRFVFVTTGYLSPEGNTFANSNAASSEVLDSIEVKKELDVFDVRRLLELYESHLSPAKFYTDVEFEIAEADYRVATIAGFNVLLASIRASELVRAFRQHQFALFRLNPRGPLQNRINGKILATLKDPARRKLFFHLNNGVTAVCESFSPRGNQVTVRGLQIVNGCQTTVTLNKVAAIVEADGDVRVLLRVVEGLAGIKEQIAEATNTQARLTAQDFKSNDPLQRDLKNQFDALPERILYEVKRGDWETQQDESRYRDAQQGVYRRIKMKDLAQATLAFLGEPGDAKDRSRTIFEDESRYKKVFPDGVRAQQLLLPWTVYQEANRQCLAWTTFSGAEYARYCLTALVGLDLCPTKVLPPVQEAARLAANTDRIRTSLARGQRAIGALYAALGKDYPGHREFFRSSDHFDKVLQAYRAQPE